MPARKQIKSVAKKAKATPSARQAANAPTQETNAQRRARQIAKASGKVKPLPKAKSKAKAKAIGKNIKSAAVNATQKPMTAKAKAKAKKAPKSLGRKMVKETGKRLLGLGSKTPAGRIAAGTAAAAKGIQALGRRASAHQDKQNSRIVDRLEAKKPVSKKK